MVNKKIILSVLIIGCIATVAGAGTWAYYSTSATSSNNSFTAGKMDINVTEEIGNVAGIKPGDKIGDKEIVIKNEGNIDIGSVKLTFTSTDNDLSQNIEFKKVTVGNKDLKNKGVLSGLNNETLEYKPNSSIIPGDSFTIILKGLEMKKEVTEGQGQTSTLSIKLEAEQAH
ncbi:MAG: TasA family protein [Methanosarcina sp.]|nr:TasA family protein [Methanosarcina sp.]MDD4521461.1 TasA family protein [Methanosarcina sp.]